MDDPDINDSLDVAVEVDAESGDIVEDIKPSTAHRFPAKEYTTKETLLLAYQSLGVVYGDLVTSPVNVFSATSLTNLKEEDLLGTFSLIFWTLTIIVWIKYVFIVLDANDDGEGGTFALYSYLSKHIRLENKLMSNVVQTTTNLGCEVDDEKVKYRSRFTRAISPMGLKIKKFLETNHKAQNALVLIVLMGTCMVIGDGALTPATCVLSAIQGIQSCSSKITQGHVVFISVVLLIVLFLFQHYGTSHVSFMFSPIMLLWLFTNSAVGIYNILKYYPLMLKAISPHYIALFVSRDVKAAWTILGAVFLGITGAEAMFADLGHFNKKAIQWAYSFIVYPSLILAYAGETAYLIRYPENITNAYYSSLPKSVYWPMFAISTLAAIVASQSMISASFSIVKQSQELGCFPRVSVIHTSSKYEGQVYSPEINYGLMTLCVGLVIGFKGGTALANAYGVVCIWVMIITTMLTTLVMLVVWNYSILFVLAFFVPYILIEGIFMTSLLNKIPQGGWVPFAISVFLGTIMLAWRYGRNEQSIYETEHKINPHQLNQMISTPEIHRSPGICFLFADIDDGIPPIVGHYIWNTKCIREIVVILKIKTLPIATVLPDERYNVEKLGDEGVYSCLIQLGYRDSLNLEEESNRIAAILAESGDYPGNTIEQRSVCSSETENEAVFVVGKIILRAKRDKRWLDRFTIDYVYRFLEKNCRSYLSGVRFPPEKTLQVGMVYEI
ncbi:OLC1v1019418C1 [Oldenlandia corymbosa var. corymbosa]|uniref:Potassium transporter n=1 Tax=Oldenlandia corymbosa var. corymbosa TaxID=529605 RepID=A0AAV1EE06_OLDCO|nr:OLC1v1019418C1 [Oldenlandia corymbosa var. corymbosa]